MSCIGNCFNWFKSLFTNDEEVNQSETNCSSNEEKETKSEIKTEKLEDFNKEDDLDYNMSHKNRGICLILNHYKYRNQMLAERNGTNNDCSKLETRFGALGFKVIKCQDLTYDQIFNVIKKVSSQDHSKNDCFVCCVLTHGLENGYVFAFDREYKLLSLLKHFTPDSCPTLSGKPKIFIVQACRGHKFDDGVSLSVLSTDSHQSRISSSFIPQIPDFLVVFSSMPDHYSFRDTMSGSWLIQSLTKLMLDNYEKDIDFLSLLTIVNRFIAIEHSSKCEQYKDKKQTMNISHTLTKRILFYTQSTQKAIS